MGAARLRREAFFKAHPICAYCDGVTQANTEEHCPPRAMFQNKHAPEGFIFPACEACNAGSSDDDLLVSMLARMDPFKQEGNLDGRVEGLIKNVNRQFPGMLRRMIPTAQEARRFNREAGVTPPAGQTHQEQGAAHVTEEMDAAVRRFAVKLSKSLFYKEANRPFPQGGAMIFAWETNADWLRRNGETMFDKLKDAPGAAMPLVRNGRHLEDQFSYRFAISVEHDIFLLMAMFGRTFGFVVFGSRDVERFESMMNTLRAEHGDGPFRRIA